MQAPYSSIWPQAWRHFLSIEFGLPVRRLTSTPPSKPPSHRTENSLGNQWRHTTHLTPESLLQSPSLHVFVLITHDVYTFVSVTSIRQVKARSWVGQIHCKARCSRTTRRWVTVTPILFHLTWSTRLPSLSVRRRVGCNFILRTSTVLMHQKYALSARIRKLLKLSSLSRFRMFDVVCAWGYATIWGH